MHGMIAGAIRHEWSMPSYNPESNQSSVRQKGSNSSQSLIEGKKSSSKKAAGRNSTSKLQRVALGDRSLLHEDYE